MVQTSAPEIWVYGDSWPFGSELNDIVEQAGPGPHRRAFPFLIAEELGVKVNNRSIPGSSQQRMVDCWLEELPQPGDHAIFCLTSNTRRTYILPDGSKHEQQYDFDERLVNAYQDRRINASVCCLLYFLCMIRNVRPWFMYLFDVSRIADPLLDQMPDDCWLIPRNESVLSYLFDPEYFHQWDNHHTGNFEDWARSDRTRARELMFPLEYHPNLVGHQEIARHVSKTLKEKFNES